MYEVPEQAWTENFEYTYFVLLKQHHQTSHAKAPRKKGHALQAPAWINYGLQEVRTTLDY